jgi:hypothetical protein
MVSIADDNHNVLKGISCFSNVPRGQVLIPVTGRNTVGSGCAASAKSILQLIAVMGGPNLEVFKFGLYLFVPVFALLHFGDPDWYQNHVLPVGFELGFLICRLTNYHSTKRNYSLPKRKQIK